MKFLDSATIQCPYCGEEIDIMVDTSIESQDYIEDCQVCCKPIEISVTVEDNEVSELLVRSNDE